MSAFNYKKLFIHNIDYKTHQDDIANAFRRIGKMRYCDVPVEKNGRLKGYAFVEYYDAHLAEVALSKLNNTNIGVRAIKIEYSNRFKEGTTNNQGGDRNERNESPRRRGGGQRDFYKDNRRSRSYEYSPSPRRNSRSHDSSYLPKTISSFDIRKQYTKNFFEAGEFNDETPEGSEIEAFLKKTLKQGPTIIDTSGRSSDRHNDRRIPKRSGYSKDRRDRREYRDRDRD